MDSVVFPLFYRQKKRSRFTLAGKAGPFLESISEVDQRTFIKTLNHAL